MPELKIDPLLDIVRSTFRDYTPVRLRLFLVTTSLFALLFGMLTTATIQKHEQALKAIGADAAPSVVSSFELSIASAAMDRALATELMYPKDTKQARQSVTDFCTWQDVMCKQLIIATKNITFGKAEEVPLQSIQIGFAKFISQAQMARDFHDSGDSESALVSYRNALQILQTTLIPNIDLLRKANAEVLETTFSQEESESSLSGGFVIVAGIALVTLLVFIQNYLRRRFRRRINPPILFASLLTIAFSQLLYPALQSNSLHLKAAKLDCYDSIVLLLNARAKMFDASAAQSRWLLDRQNALSHQKIFDADLAELASFSGQTNLADAISKGEQLFARKAKLRVPGLTGAIASEMANVQFPGEGEGTLEMLRAFGQFQNADAQIRKLESSNDQKSAVELVSGYEPGASRFAFAKFDDALLRTLRINNEQFDEAIKDARTDLIGLNFYSIIISILLIMCTYAGLKNRMAEFVI